MYRRLPEDLFAPTVDGTSVDPLAAGGDAPPVVAGRGHTIRALDPEAEFQAERWAELRQSWRDER